MDPEKLAEVNEKLVSLMRKAFAGGTEVRFENLNIKTCWMMTECPRPDRCPLYGRRDVRCWQAMGTFSEEGGCCRLAEVLDCRVCDVYRESVGDDPMTEIGETFNNMMHLIERTQGRLVEMEKLATAGKLAASVAHEINNPLFGISNYIDLIETRTGDDDEKLSGYIRIVREALNQIKHVTRGLLELARPRTTKPSEADLNGEIDKAVALIEPKAGKQKIIVRKEFDPELGRLRFDREAMQQVFLNIMINALDSMPDGGELYIATKKTDSQAELIFRDTGAGIKEHDLPRIFDLFFSRKATGLGTGIGLYTARRIIDDHDGRIRVTSRPGEGAEFSISLPLSPDARGVD